ncbi:class I SAM-dependent methyltransferase [Streptomyces sp. NPDC057939]|uniref:class I SAM-dependent methyltransferase n=1 Tax=Streptomyces sp. NPDC057939 TaxID=3346284 RepID=UPI0036E64E65
MTRTGNADQAEAWNGYEGSHWARSHARWDAVNDGFNAPLLDAAAVSGTDHVLDIGCGPGRTTLSAAGRAASGRAVGVDLSAPAVDRARANARREGVRNASFIEADAQVHAFGDCAFDAAVSRYGMTFFGDPVAAFTNVLRALRPGGRMAFVCAARPLDNEWFEAMASLDGILPLGDFGTPGSEGMFSLSEPGLAGALLSEAGGEGVHAERLDVPGNWGRDAEDAAAFLLDSGPGRHMLGQVGPEAREEARRVLTDRLRGYEAGGAVWLRSSAWLVTAVRGGASRA